MQTIFTDLFLQIFHAISNIIHFSNKENQFLSPIVETAVETA